MVYAELRVVAKEYACRLNSYSKPAVRRRAAPTDPKKKKDWIEELIVLAPAKLKPAAPTSQHTTFAVYHMQAKLPNVDWLRQRTIFFPQPRAIWGNH